MNKTPIQWTWDMGPDGKLIPMSGSTWNPLLGCKEVSPGCRNCYAARLIGVRFSKNPKLPMYHGIATTAANGHPHFTGERRMVLDRLDEPLRTRKGRKVFVNDMGDLFFDGHPFEDIAAVFGVMAAARQHTFQVLTKRPERMAEFFAWVEKETARGRITSLGTPIALVASLAADHVGEGMLVGLLNRVRAWPLPNVWIGTSVEDRPALKRIDVLRDVPAAVRFLSIEPLIEYIGAVDWTGIHWGIIGGESGHGARPFDLAWARSLIAQMSAAGVACFLKQLGSNPVYGPAGTWHRVPLRASHGGDEAEWPADLQGLRAFPVVPT